MKEQNWMREKITEKSSNQSFAMEPRLYYPGISQQKNMAKIVKVLVGMVVVVVVRKRYVFTAGGGIIGLITTTTHHHHNITHYKHQLLLELPLTDTRS